MPEFINGLPLHALVVHFVVVLLPLAVLGSILTAVWPAVRRRFGWLTVAAAAVGALLVPVATNSGEKLQSRVGENELVRRHSELGDLMIYWAVPLFVAVAALMIVHTMGERKAAQTTTDEPSGGTVLTETRRATGTTVATVVAAVLTVGLAVGTGIHIYRVGDAGARAVWGDTQNLPPNNSGG